MKKLIKLPILMLALLFIVGCTRNDEHTDTDTGTDTDGREETSGVISGPIAVSEDAVGHLSFNAGEMEEEYHAVLIDLLTGDVLGGIMLEEDIEIFDIFNFENGYYGVLVGAMNPLFMGDMEFDFFDDDWDDDFYFDDTDFGDDDWDDYEFDGDFDDDWDDYDDHEFDDDWDDDYFDDTDFDDDDWDDYDFDYSDWDDDFLIDDAFFFEDHDENLRYLIFDDELNLIHDLLITDPHLLAFWNHFGNDVTFDGDDLIVYYAPDALHLEEENQSTSIRSYNVMTSESLELATFEATDLMVDTTDLMIDNVVLVDNHTIAFVALNFLEGSGLDLHYGTANLSSGEVILLTLDDEEFIQGGLTAVGNYVLINEGTPFGSEGGVLFDDDDAYVDDDNTDGFFSDDDEYLGDELEMRNVVQLLNAETNASREIELENGGSRWARLSSNANYIVTVTADFHSFRQYDVSNGEMIFEAILDLDHEEEPREVEIFAITESTFAVHFLSEQSVRAVELIELP